MNKKRTLIPVLLFFSLLSLPLFSSCDKDTNCYLEVLVIREADRTPIPDVIIEISQNGGQISDNGITNAEGKYSTHFWAPAILNISAKKSAGEVGWYRGETSVRLTEGEVKQAVVTMTDQIFYN